MANVLETGMSYLQTQDPEVAACIENEFQRQKQNIELIASENIASPAVIAAMVGCSLTAVSFSSIYYILLSGAAGVLVWLVKKAGVGK